MKLLYPLFGAFAVQAATELDRNLPREFFLSKNIFSAKSDYTMSISDASLQMTLK